MVDAIAAHGADHMPLMVQGRWKSPVMPTKYTRNHGAVARNAMEWLTVVTEKRPRTPSGAFNHCIVQRSITLRRLLVELTRSTNVKLWVRLNLRRP
eukprot:1307894-Amphidinium_carterae.2